MTRRNRSQMTLEAFEPEQRRLTDPELVAELDDELGPVPRDVDDDTTPAVTPHGIDEDTIAAVAPRGALDLLRQLEGAA